jgi:hypothetical protein
MNENTVSNGRSLEKSIPDSLTIFAYAWTAQSLVQLVFYPVWFEQDLVLGSIYVLLCLANFVFPGRLRLFGAMLLSSIVYYLSIWPYVVNHVYADSFLAVTMLGALGIAFGGRLFSSEHFSREDAETWFLKFAPVLGATFAFVYISIIISKMNVAFFDTEISCLTGMIEEAEANRPYISPLLGLFSVQFYFWFFIVAESLLPIMLLFRRTRLAAFYFGVPFHLLLGVMGHWPFSSFMIALYALVAMPSLKDAVRPFIAKLDAIRQDRIPSLSGAAVFAILNVLVLASAWVLKPSVTWLLWTTVLSAAIMLGVVQEHRKHGLIGGTGVTQFCVKSPIWLLVMFALVVVNSASPYIGLKTYNNIAMYSNMRTEGDINNHFFMPAVPVFGYQKDLVEIVDSNSDKIMKMKTHHSRFGYVGQQFEVYQTYFELRRAVSKHKGGDLSVSYIRDGELRTFTRGAEDNVDANLDTPPALILRKLLYFRPVFKGEKSYCLH